MNHFIPKYIILSHLTQSFVSATMFIVVNSINQEHNHTHTFCLHTHTKAIGNGRRLEEEEEKSFVVMLFH
jgi:hypothetical protein